MHLSMYIYLKSNKNITKLSKIKPRLRSLVFNANTFHGGRDGSSNFY